MSETLEKEITVEDWEKYGFKTKEKFDEFKKEFGSNWGMMLLMINPIHYSKILSDEYGIPKISYNTNI